MWIHLLFDHNNGFRSRVNKSHAHDTITKTWRTKAKNKYGEDPSFSNDFKEQHWKNCNDASLAYSRLKEVYSWNREERLNPTGFESIGL